MPKMLLVVAILFGAPAAFSQTVSSCATAAPGSAWAKGAFLPCSTTVAYVAQPVSPTAPVSDMRCAASGCVFSWQLGPRVLPTDQVWVKTTSKPAGTWVIASSVKFATSTNTSAQCTRFLYTGAPFTLVTATGSATADGLSVSAPVTGFVQLVAPLPLNGTTTFAPPNAITPPPGVLTWDFSSESIGPGTENSPTFTFTTTNGVIVAWSFTIPFVLNADATLSTVTVTSSENGDSVTSTIEGPIYPYGSLTGSSSSPGSWACQMTFTAAGTP